MSLDNLKTGISSLVFVAVLIAGLAIAMDGFQDGIESDEACSTTTAYFNSTSGICTVSASNGTQLGGTNHQYNATQEGLTGVANATSYMDTIGTLIGVGALIAIVVGAFVYLRK